MTFIRSLPRPVVQGLGLVFDREQPWRRSFLVLRTLESALGESSKLSIRARERFEADFNRYPASVVPYLEYLTNRVDIDFAKQHAQRIVDRPNSGANLTVEVAKFHYLHDFLAVGDQYIERAKQLDPGLSRIYDEEAWNQRARGNVHRELHAVERSIALASNESTKLYWRGWRIEALVRQGQFEEAWKDFSSFPPLPSGDMTLLIAAYCARNLGLLPQVNELYRRFAPLDDGFDLFEVARLQFEKYQHADEAAALLSSLDESSETPLLELSFYSRVQLGELDVAIEHAQHTVRRPDSTSDLKSQLGQLLELLDRPTEALVAYLSAEPRQRSLLHRFRISSILEQDQGPREAVDSYLEQLDLSDGIPTEGLHREADRQLLDFVNEYNSGIDSHLHIEYLSQIVSRASSRELRWQASARLAVAFAADNAWDKAWLTIQSAQYNRLPSLQLTLEKWSDLGSSRNMFYHECCETEALQPRTVLFESSLGASTSCNPLAISLELLRDPVYADMLQVWSIEAHTAIHPSLRDLPNVVFVRKGSSGHFRYLACAGFIVNNSTIEYNFTKREGQRYLNTWHGVPWKTMGRDNRSEPFAYGNISRNFLHADVVIGPDPHTLDVLSRGHDVKELIPHAFVQAGYPRNDLAVNLTAEGRGEIRSELGVSQDNKLALFIPTWRGTFTKRDADVQQVIDTAKGLVTPGFTIAVRAHHYVSDAFRDAPTQDGFIFVPPHLDTNELIGAADVVITDFSSVLFDAAAVGVPVVKLIADIDTYAAERGLYFTADEVPGANARNINEARTLVVEAAQDPEGFTAEYGEQTARFSSLETGVSARQAIALLFGSAPQLTETPSKRTVLISTGGLPPNGITRSARSLIAALQSTNYSPYLIPNRNALDGAEPETLADVRRYSHVLPMVPLQAGTRMEREVLQFFSTRRYFGFPLASQHLKHSQVREARRLFGTTEFHSAVEFSAYDSKNIALIGYGVQVEGGRRGVIFHNEMWKEVEKKYPRLRPGLESLDRMEFCASVSDGVRDYNAATMHEHFGVPLEKHITIENTINVDEIQSLAEVPIDTFDEDWYATDGAHACIIARLSHEKNHAQLFAALADSRDQLSRPVKLTCLGDGPLRLDLQQQIAELGIGDLVRLRGLVPNPQAHLRAAGALILPSLHEGQPLVLLEALTVGTPVVATDTPGSRSVLHDGAFGPLVPITPAGLLEALHRVADGRLDGSLKFDPETFTQRSLRMFTSAIDTVL